MRLTNIEKNTTKDPLINSFIEKEENKILIKNYTQNPNRYNREKLNDAFWEFSLKVAAISYFSKAIHSEAKRFDYNIRKNKDRYKLILDKPIDDGTELTMKEKIEGDNLYEPFPKTIQDVVKSEKLNNALNQLNNRKKYILLMKYYYEKTEKEIGNDLYISQQSVSKQLKLALDKLREHMIGRDK